MKNEYELPNHLPGEEVVFVLRRHWIVFLRRFLSFVILALVPLVLLLLAGSTALDPVVNREPVGVLIVAAASAYYLFIALHFFHIWLDYYLDVWIVSTKRIANIDQRGLFSRIVSELQMENVQDVTVEVKGISATMLHFGDIYIQTAAEQSRFYFDDIPNPYDVARRIMELHNHALVGHTPPPDQQSAPTSGTPAAQKEKKDPNLGDL